MSTKDKALNLLAYFSIIYPEWGLSKLSRKSGYDKATKLRLLRSLSDHQMIEQDSGSRKYRLGTAFLNFARIREKSFPLSTVLKSKLNNLARITNETAHASLAANNGMATIALSEPLRATFVHVDSSELLPFHATASGTAYLAFGPNSALDSLKQNSTLKRYADNAPRDLKYILEKVDEARRKGCSEASQSYKNETIGIAVPLFDKNGDAQGSIAVVGPTLRIKRKLEQVIWENLFEVTIEAARDLGAVAPDDYRKLAEKHL